MRITLVSHGDDFLGFGFCLAINDIFATEYCILLGSWIKDHPYSYQIEFAVSSFI